MHNECGLIGDLPRAYDVMPDLISDARDEIIKRMTDANEAHQYYDDLVDIISANSNSAYKFVESLTYILLGGDECGKTYRMKQLRDAYKKCVEEWAEKQAYIEAQYKEEDIAISEHLCRVGE